MMQASQQRSESFQPRLVDEVMLGIDPVQLSVTLRGEQHQFDDKIQMERFLRGLWEAEIPA